MNSPAIFILLAVIWGMLTYSEIGILIQWTAPYLKDTTHNETMNCTYITGLGIVTTTFWYNPTGILGKVKCPRFIDL